jgi:hypothetical protein
MQKGRLEGVYSTAKNLKEQGKDNFIDLIQSLA